MCLPDRQSGYRTFLSAAVAAARSRTTLLSPFHVFFIPSISCHVVCAAFDAAAMQPGWVVMGGRKRG
jgi:hypothetical protein